MGDVYMALQIRSQNHRWTQSLGLLSLTLSYAVLQGL
jgi:hypothetical protein